MIRVYKVRLKFEEPVSVVAESDGNKLVLMRSSVIRWKDGGYEVIYNAPVIPASSLKGALRHFFLSLAKSLYDCEVLRAHEEDEEPKVKGYPKVLPHHYDKDLIKKYEDELEEVKKFLIEEEGVSEEYFREEGVEYELWERLASLSCPVCLLFGSNYVAGALRLSDVTLKVGGERVLTRVTIDRALGKAKENKLFNVEVAEEAEGEGLAVLAFTEPLRKAVERVAIPCNGKSPIEVAEELWEEGKRLLEEEGLELGHGKSAGLGRARVEFEEL